MQVFASRLALATSGLDFGDAPTFSQSPSPPPSNHSELAAKLLSMALPRVPNTTIQGGSHKEQIAQSPRVRDRGELNTSTPNSAPTQSEGENLRGQIPDSPGALLARARTLLDEDRMCTTTSATGSMEPQADGAAHLQPTPLRLLPSPEVSPAKQKRVPNLATASLPPHPPYTGLQGRDSVKSTERSSHCHDALSSSSRRDSPGADGGRKKELAAVAWMMDCLQSMMISHETYQRKVVSKVNLVSGKLGRLETAVSRLKKPLAQDHTNPDRASSKGAGLPPPPGPNLPRALAVTAGQSGADPGPLIGEGALLIHRVGEGGAAARTSSCDVAPQIPPAEASSSSSAPASSPSPSDPSSSATAATAATAATVSLGRLKPPPKAVVANARSRRPAGRCKSYAVSMPSRGSSVQKVSYKNTTGVDSTYTLSIRGREGHNGGPPPEAKLPEPKIFVKAGEAAIVSVVFAMGEAGEGGVVSVGVRNCADDGREDVLRFELKRDS